MQEPEALVVCTNLYGRKIEIPREKLIIRPAVYAVIRQNGHVALLTSRNTGKYSLPGGGVEIGEPMVTALHREVREETGLAIEAPVLAHFKEDFFYYDPTDVAFHSFLFFYHCRPKTLTFVADHLVDDGEVEKPRWIPVAGLATADFQSHGPEILQLLQSP